MPTITGYLSVKLAQSAWRHCMELSAHRYLLCETKSLVWDLINTLNMKYAQNFGSKYRTKSLQLWDTWTKLVPIGITEAGWWLLRNKWRHFRPITFFYMRSAFFLRIKCLWFSRNACIFKLHYTPGHFSKLNFTLKIRNLTMQICSYQEGAKIKHWSEWASFDVH